ncbi:MAG TPA: hypothetical protein VI341_02500 [Actinomycetota bacterium]
MPTGRRLATLLLVLALVALPAVALRAFCIGKSCQTSEATASVAVPFCPLPASLRTQIAAGFREDRSPDALGVTSDAGTGINTPIGDDVEVPWPSVLDSGLNDGATRVPIAFFGDGFTGSAPPEGTGLDQIAPTLAQAIGYRRPHPEVRSGTPVRGVTATAAQVRDDPLIVEIVWKAVGSSGLQRRAGAWPFLRSIVRDTGTMEGTTGSLPVDPSATLTTIGTGGLPSQHGITGTVLRGPDGAIARAWMPGAPSSVIATLADDLDASSDQAARVGAVLDDASDRGLIGDGWYLGDRDRDDVVVSDHPVAQVTRLLDEGFGSDGHPGLIGVVVRGSISGMDDMTEAIVRLVRKRVPDATFAVTATGDTGPPGRTSSSEDILDVAAQVDATVGAPIVAAEGAGGLFLDRVVSSERSITADTVAEAMATLRGADGDEVFLDAFPSFAVSFARYC